MREAHDRDHYNTGRGAGRWLYDYAHLPLYLFSLLFCFNAIPKAISATSLKSPPLQKWPRLVAALLAS